MRGRDLAHLSDEALVTLVARVGRSGARGALRPRRRHRVRPRLSRAARRGARARTPCRRRSSALWRSAGSFLPERAKASTWILTLVHRRAVDVVRREQRRRTEPFEDAPEPVGRLRRGGRLAALRAPARADGARDAAGPAARGDRARLLRRADAVGARRAARAAARDDQEPDVLGPLAPARAARRRHRRLEGRSWTSTT